MKTSLQLWWLLLCCLLLNSARSQDQHQLGMLSCNTTKPFKRADNYCQANPSFRITAGPTAVTAGDPMKFDWLPYNWNADMYQIRIFRVSEKVLENGGNLNLQTLTLDESQLHVECAEMYDKSESGWNIWDSPPTFYNTTARCDWTGTLVVKLRAYKRKFGAWKTMCEAPLWVVTVSPRVIALPVQAPYAFCGTGMHTMEHNSIDPNLITRWYKSENGENKFLGEGSKLSYNFNTTGVHHFALTYRTPEGCGSESTPLPVTAVIHPGVDSSLATPQYRKICGTGLQTVEIPAPANTTTQWFENIDSNSPFAEGNSIERYFEKPGIYTLYYSFKQQCGSGIRAPIILEVKNSGKPRAPKPVIEKVAPVPGSATVSIDVPENQGLLWLDEEVALPDIIESNPQIFTLFESGVVHRRVAYIDSSFCESISDKTLVSVIGIGATHSTSSCIPLLRTAPDCNNNTSAAYCELDEAGNFQIPADNKLDLVYYESALIWEEDQHLGIPLTPDGPNGFRKVCVKDIPADVSTLRYSKTYLLDLKVRQKESGYTSTFEIDNKVSKTIRALTGVGSTKKDCSIPPLTSSDMVGCEILKACPGSTTVMGPGNDENLALLKKSNLTQYRWFPETGLDNPRIMNPNLPYNQIPADGFNKYILTISNPLMAQLIGMEGPLTYCQVVYKCPYCEPTMDEESDDLPLPQFNRLQNTASMSALSIGKTDMNAFRVYPNPATEHLTFSVPEVNISSLLFTVMNSSGQIILKGNLFSGKDTQVNVSHLTKGIYTVRLTTAEGAEIFKEIFILGK